MKRRETRLFDARIDAIASRQHGIVTRSQLLATGMTREMVDRRVKSGRLRPLHRGVYLNGALIGALIPGRARELAAVLACGPGAVVSHRSAASLWELLPPLADAAPIDITVPAVDRGRRAGIRPHRVASLAAADAAVVGGVPVTAPTRTLLDLAGRVRLRELEQALAQAERRAVVDMADLPAAVERAGPRRGTPALRALLAAGQRPALTRSAAEERLLALIRSGSLPPPDVNARLGSYEVDFLWQRERVAVEVDGFAYHASRRNFEHDRRRDAQLAAQGIHMVRVTWRQLIDEPEAVLVRLAQTLARAGPEQCSPGDQPVNLYR